METISIPEMLDYVAAVDLAGITLTESGLNAARAILERRADWTDSHRLMLDRIVNGQNVLPHKLRRLVNRTRLGDALELARRLSRSHLRNQKTKARRKAAKARAMARAAA